MNKKRRAINNFKSLKNLRNHLKKFAPCNKCKKAPIFKYKRDKTKAPWRDKNWQKKKAWEKYPLPLIINPYPHKPKVMVITEAPQFPRIDIENFYTFDMGTFLLELFKGKFYPRGKNANVYWTHYQKCPKYNTLKEECADHWLPYEILFFKPELIIAVGNRVKKWLKKYIENSAKLEYFESHELTLRFSNKHKNLHKCKIIVIPHPSGRNRYWNNYQEIKEKFFSARNAIMKFI